ncbi:MFS transporter [Sorangium cellulosum]|uniref:Phosphoserine aminotransferase n=1 Tax=Sorangium cellulosum TaxID=56 RepID=A0A2L0EXK6_SORCE|nr:3-phosphoserine/phosphohydroxythreonine transaminase [Sorangium cellulosum]AUX44016.1 MFS transporter [Sorangium cellulosum]
MARVHNFNAGPAGLPLPPLERAQRELLDFEGTGMSIMEHSHRGKAFEAVHNEAISLLRQLLRVPDDYHVLFMQGGAAMQFALVPMNLLPPDRSADYIMTGGWSEKALEEAKRVGTVRVAASTAVDKRYTRIPHQNELSLDPNAAYVHMTTNNTLFGTQWHWLPDTGDVPLVADMSSDILWRPIDVSRFALIYAGAQKNIGPSGVTVVLVRKDLVDRARKDIPVIFRYATYAANNSLYNTPPTFAIYLMRNVLAYTLEIGGLEELERRNRKKAELLYATLDAKADFFLAPAEKESRSFMNVVFRLPSEDLEKRFVAEAAKEGMVGLAGHRSTGGIRVSTYNAVTIESVERLTAFMRDFAKRA